ncbi:MAG TPA: CHAT domain-containing protein [Anaerolineae bacterium]|nr:CHAT domain-containing protein [Anaerolineae bacterium]
MPETPKSDYTDLLIRIFPQDETEVYPVEATLNGDRVFSDGELALDLDALRQVESNAEEYGRALFYALFIGRVREAYDVAVGLAGTETEGRLRLRLWIDPKASELHALNWERLAQPAQTPFTTAAATPFSRYSPRVTDLGKEDPPPVSQWPRRMLFAIANPTNLSEQNLAALDVEKELRNLLDVLAPHLRSGSLHLTVMHGRTPLPDDLRADIAALDGEIYDDALTLTDLMRRLNEQPYHILHFLGHGSFSRRSKSAALILEDATGAMQAVGDVEFAKQLKALQAPPHLVFLSSCQSAARDPGQGNPFVGLAPRLVQYDTLAVVAMQDFVPISVNQQLVQDFYRYLLQHGLVDVALNQARLALYNQKFQSWDVPALFMRPKHGQLFTADPVRTALTAMLTAKLFNPLAANEPYLPVEVQHFKGLVDANDLRALSHLETPALDLSDALARIFAPAKVEIGPHGPSIVALVGDEGMGKSVSLRRLGYVTARNSLEKGAATPIVPVYINLEKVSRTLSLDSQDIQTMLAQALQPFWGDDAARRVADLLRAQSGPILRVMVDGSDGLPDHIRRRAWCALNRFIMENSRHEYILAVNPGTLATGGLAITDVLVMQPISRHNLQRFLTKTLKDPAGAALYTALGQARLFDLAAMPWLLFEMLKQTQQGAPPQSRVQVLGSVVADRIAEIAADRGMRAKATETLYALAWEMGLRRRSALPVHEAFALMAQVRGTRGYDLEDFYQQLISYELLQPIGDEMVCFSRAILRDYCFARALTRRSDSDAQLDDITATLGRYARYRWWEESLVLLSGMLDDPGVLIRQLLYGAPLGEGEQIFLAARCIQEQARVAELDPQLLNYVANILLWRLRYSADPRPARRVRIIQALAQLQAPAALAALIDIAYPPVAPPPINESDYDYNTIRLAAMLALRQMTAPPYVPIANRAPQLAELLNLWARQDVDALLPFVFKQDEQDAESQAIAAFALGDLKTTRGLVKLFMTPGLPATVRRNVVTGLSLLDANTVAQQVVLPLLDPERTPDPTPWKPMLAYLIGKVCLQEPPARAFLYTCLREDPDIQLKGLALQSLGWMYDLKSKQRFEDIALGDFSSLGLPEDAPPLPPDAQLLQRRALEALRVIGDAATLTRLQRRPAALSPELEQAFYWTIEEIIVRQNEE